MTPTKEHYTTALVKLFLQARIIRLFEGKLISTHKLIEEDTIYFFTEDDLCREWLNSVYDSYHFYDGFATLEECQQYIFSTPYPNRHYVIMSFRSMYYAVVYENTQCQQVIGKGLSYYTKNNLFLVSERPPNNLMLKERERLPVIPTIYHELLAFDCDLTAYTFDGQHFVHATLEDMIPYIVLLGITFKDMWYTCDSSYTITRNKFILNAYFHNGHGFTTFGKYCNALAINPFQRLLFMTKKRLEHFQMDIDAHHSTYRVLPYREVRRLSDNMRSRPFELSEAY